MNPNSFNWNWKVTIYPNARGWEKIHELTAEKYQFDWVKTVEWVSRKRSNDGGYTDQLWCIASELHSMFYNGQNYLENTTVKLHPE